MKQDFRRLSVAPLALALAFGASACAGDDKNDGTLAADSALNRDLNLAGADTAAQPQLTDVPAGTATAPATATRVSSGTTTPAPRRTTPAPAPARTTPARTASGNTVTRNPTTGGSGAASGGGSVGSIASGTSITLTSNARVCTNTYKVGQTFTATVSDGVTGSNGASIPAGATATLEVTELSRSENMNDNVTVGLRVRSIRVGGQTYAVSANVSDARVDKVRNQPRRQDAQKVIGGAVIGAVIGQATGKDTRSTVIGGAAGAAAGTAAAAATANYEGCIPDGGRITISLTDAVQVRA